MKLLILLTAIVSSSLAKSILDANKLNIQNANFELDHKLVDDFLEKHGQAKIGDDDGSMAVINELVDKIFANIQTKSLADGLDPVSLDDVNQDFLSASITLTDGLLHGVSTIGRTGDSHVFYDSGTKKLQIHLPIVFTNLNVTYDYLVSILLIRPTGVLTEQIDDFDMDIMVTFDFNTYQANIDSIDTTDTGHVSLKLEGNGVVDILVNTLTEFSTTILHPLIIPVLQKIVSDVANQAVDTVNDAINSALHPGSSA